MLKFALKNLKTKLFRALLAAIAVILCTTIALVSYNTANQMEDGVISTAGYYDTIVGPEGSPLQLALSSMFFVENPLGTIPYKYYEELKENPSVSEIYPFAAGDTYRSVPIIGTVPEYLAQNSIIDGKMFSENEEAVLGYNVAATGVLKIGDHFHGVHGFSDHGHDHDDFEYEVVGLLAKTGTALDNVIFATVESVWEIHDDNEEEHYADEDHHDLETHDDNDHHHDEDEDDDHHHDEDHEGELVALILKTESLAAHNEIVAHYENVPGVQAINPAAVLRNLLDNLSLGRDVLYILAAVIMFMTAVIIYVTTASFIEDSKKDILIMRLVGIKRKTIFSMFIVQSAFISLISIVVSFLLSMGILTVINTFTSQNLGILIDSAKRYPGEGALLLTVFLIVIISAVVSIIPAYRRDPLEVK